MSAPPPAGNGRRLLVVTTVPETATGFLRPYADHLRTQGWRVELATGHSMSGGAPPCGFDRLHSLPWSRSIRDPGNLVALKDLRRLLAAQRFDIVHCHTPIAGAVTRLAVASLRRRPAIVYTAHGFHFIDGGPPAANAAFAAAERLCGRWTDRLVVINEDDYAEALRRRIVPPDRLVHLPGIGVDLDHYAPSAELHAAADVLRDTLGLGPDDVLMTMVAEFQPGKNHRTLVQALSLLDDQRLHLALAGDGPLRPQVAAQVAELGLADRVHLLGLVSDVRPVVLASAATVLPSRREGLSRSVLESLALGVPVVGADTRGIRELLSPRTGIVVDADDAPGLADALVRVRSLPGRGALRPETLPLLQRFSLSHLIELHDELYESVLAGRA